jgi:glycosyltransferase involved in cell wall biosynthesis
LTPQLPYPPHQGTTKGTTIRNYGLLAGLAQRHDIHLLSFCTSDDDPAGARPLQDACVAIHTVPEPVRTMTQRMWTMLASPLPDIAHRLASPVFEATLRSLLGTQSFDVVELEGIEMVPYLPLLVDYVTRVPQPPCLVFDDHNAEYVLQRRVFEMDIRQPRRWPGAFYSLIQWKKLLRYEAWACRHVDVVAAVSEIDACALRHIAPDCEIAVVPNGVDIAAYSTYTAPADALPLRSLVFTGTMDYRPNIDAVLWFARRVLPLIQKAIPDVQFYVVGRHPHERLAPLNEQPGVVVTGGVPDTRPYIAGAAVYVVPLRSGGGTRLKVLEAMAMRVPLVSTTMGCDGFPVVSGREVVLADEPESFAQQVIDLLLDTNRRDELGQAGFEFAAAHYDWSAIVPLLEAAIDAKHASLV